MAITTPRGLTYRIRTGRRDLVGTGIVIPCVGIASTRRHLFGQERTVVAHLPDV